MPPSIDTAFDGTKHLKTVPSSKNTALLASLVAGSMLTETSIILVDYVTRYIDTRDDQ